MTEKLDEKDVLKTFSEGFDCSQIVLSNVCEKLEITKDEALKMAACFGGGMWHGDTCGCVIGALIALGLKYGTTIPNDKEKKDELLKKKIEFEKQFTNCFGSCLCKEVLGYNLSKEEDMKKIQEQHLFETKCPQAVIKTCEILERML